MGEYLERGGKESHKSYFDRLVANQFTKVKDGKIVSEMLNAGRTEEYFTNSKGFRMHARTEWGDCFEQYSLPPVPAPKNKEYKAVIVSVHGLGGHNNRPTQVYWAHEMLSKGYQFVTFDLQGHGWSENYYPKYERHTIDGAQKRNSVHGRAVDEEHEKVSTEQRAYFDSSRCAFDNWRDLLDDVFCFLRALYDIDGLQDKIPTNAADGKPHSLNYYAKRKDGSCVPFFLQGLSLGGALSIMSSSLLNKLRKREIPLLQRTMVVNKIDVDVDSDSDSDDDGDDNNGKIKGDSVFQFGMKKNCFSPIVRTTVSLARRLVNAPVLTATQMKALENNAFHALTLGVYKRGGGISDNSLLVGSVNDVLSEKEQQGQGSATEQGQGQGDSTIPSSNGDSADSAIWKAFNECPAFDTDLLPVARAMAGVLFVSPAFSTEKPPAHILAALKYMLVPLFPRQLVPDWIRENDDTTTWKDANYLGYNDVDRYPQGLSWGHNARFGVAGQVLDMFDSVTAEMSSYSVKYLILMDPEEKVVSFDGVKQLMNTCGSALQGDTWTDNMQEKEGSEEYCEQNEYGRLELVPDGRHDVICNNTDLCIDSASAFFEETLKAFNRRVMK